MASTNFFIRFRRMCEERGETMSQVCSSIELGSREHAKWERGIMPGIPTVLAVSEHFEVSPAFMLAGLASKGDKVPPLVIAIGGMTLPQTRYLVNAITTIRERGGQS